MNMQPHDPLSPEEQALAGRLHRLGGAEGPSAALDARILAAARGAAAPASASRRRWRAWSAMSGGAMTAVGTAAALVLAVGLVWQLRPVEQPAPVREAAGDDGGFVPVERVERQAQPAAASGPATVPEPGPRPARADARLRTPAPAPGTTTPAPAASTPNGDDGAAVVVAPGPGASHGAPRAAIVPGPEPVTQPVATGTAAAVTAESAASTSVTAAESAQASGPSADAAPSAQRRPTYTSSARARPEMRSDPGRSSRQAAARAAPQDVAPPTDAPGFGTVAADAELAPAGWLQRIRDRRERGDIEGAIESLRRFRETHPRVRLPEDLRALAE